MWGRSVEGSVGSPWTWSVVGVRRLAGISVFGLPLSRDPREKLAERGVLFIA